MSSLKIPDRAERGDLGSFVARVVRLDQMAAVRLRATDGRVAVWAPTPFDALVTRSVHGTLEPTDVTASASGLLTALTVERSETIDPGSGALWPGELPPDEGWYPVDDVPVAELERLTERGLAVAKENAGPHGPPTSLLDQVVLTVAPDVDRAAAAPGRAAAVKVPMRCLFALSGMGFLGAVGDGGSDVVRVSANGSWLRLDARYGAVVRRRITALPLLIG
ncbi:hypothetical protein [Pseudonocardia humida]|uniref:Type III secretion system (T3SS) SseB-like protein n=1 Tax=Pseudonocardia humida TaxID=2800819 RepID=A0ABT0ZU71_9PSEU|nr:hypothetical protein [Pseudonocardia humida]MCO1654268.1 hypothetical protein [Pseudonocardia humida]